MTLTRRRRPPSYNHEPWCCQIHDIDRRKDPAVVCVGLGWMLHATSTRTVLVDGVPASPVPFYNEAQRFVPIDTTRWVHTVDLEEAYDNGL